MAAVRRWRDYLSIYALFLKEPVLLVCLFFLTRWASQSSSLQWDSSIGITPKIAMTHLLTIASRELTEHGNLLPTPICAFRFPSRIGCLFTWMHSALGQKQITKNNITVFTHLCSNHSKKNRSLWFCDCIIDIQNSVECWWTSMSDLIVCTSV